MAGNCQTLLFDNNRKLLFETPFYGSMLHVVFLGEMMLSQLFERSKTNNMSNKSLQFVQDLSVQCTLLRFLHVCFHRTGRWADGSDGGGATATAGGRVAKGAVGATFVDLAWLISMVGTLASKIPTLDPR